MKIKRIPNHVKDPSFTNTIDLTEVSKGVFVYLPAERASHKATDESPLYYRPDGKGGIKFIYPDKPPGKSWTL